MGLGDYVLFIVANRQGAGKTTAAALCSELFDEPAVSSSGPVTEELERERGLPAGTIGQDRAHHREHWRPELVELGDRMALSERPAATICLDRGYRIIDGIRRPAELQRAIDEVRRRGWVPFVLFIEAAAADNDPTADFERVDELRALATVVVSNDLRERTRDGLLAFSQSVIEACRVLQIGQVTIAASEGR